MAERTGLKHLCVNDVVKEKECHEGFDEEFKSYIVDDDKVGSLATCTTSSSTTNALDNVLVAR